MKTELETKSVSLLLVTIMLCSISTGAVTADVNKSAANTSLAFGNPRSCIGCAGYEPWYYYAGGIVNTANGNLYLAEEKDISIKARGFDIELVRSYNSHNSGKHGPFGFGWTFNYNIYLVKNKDGSVTFFDEDGSAHTFTPAGGNNYTAPPGIDSKLTKNADDSFTLWFTDGSKYNFGSNGKINNITDKNGNHLNFEYNILGRLTRISDDSGLYLNLNYNLRGRINSVSDTLGREIRYEYNVSDLTKVTDAMGHSTRYEYYDNHKLKNKKDRIGSILLFSYNENNRVKDVKTTIALGDVRPTLFEKEKSKQALNYIPPPLLLYSFNYENDIVYINDARGYTAKIQLNVYGNPINMTDPMGGVRRTVVSTDMNIIKYTDENGHSTSYEYDAYGNLIKKTDALGNLTCYGYNTIDTETNYRSLHVNITNGKGFTTNLENDAKGNLIKVTDATGNRSFFEYDTFGNIINITDYRGYSTKYAYDVHGYTLSVTGASGNVTGYSYDGVGRLITTTDENGHVTSYEYDANDNLVKVVDALGNETKYEYNAEGTLTKTIDANGRETDVGNNIIGKVEGITDASENKTSFKYDNNGNLVEYTNEKGSNTTIIYDALNRETSVTDALGNKENYEYDAVGNLIKETDKNGGVTTYTYDALNRLIKTTDALGYTTVHSYDAVDNLISMEDANGYLTKYEYDALDRLIRVTDTIGGEDIYFYDANGNQLSYTDANGHATRYEYDALNRLTKIIDPTGNESTRTYDAVGNLKSLMDRNGHITSYDYDALNRLTKITDAFGNNAYFTYDAVGNIKTEKNARGFITSYFYDELDRLIKTSDAAGNSILNSYDEVGDLIKVTDEEGNSVSYEYDALDRLISFTDALNHQTKYEYDAVENLIKETDANGHGTRYQYDAFNRLIKEIDPSLSEISYEYDIMGGLLSVTDENRHTTRYEYDELYRLTKVISPLGYTTQYDYDAIENIIERIDANGNITTYTYDELDRIISDSYPDGGYVSYSYDAEGNTLQVSNHGVGLNDTTFYTYDDLYRPTSTTVNYGLFSRTVNYTYDENGNRAITIDPEGGVTRYECDALDRLVKLINPSGEVTTYQYDNASRRIGISYPNGINTTYSYNAADMLLNLVNKKSTGETISSYSYTHGKVGNRLSMTEANGNVTNYEYDALYRLVKVNYPNGNTTGYTYDKAGNRVSKTENASTIFYTYDADNRLLNENGISYSYDNDGNLISKSDGTKYGYDYENRLTKVMLPDTNQVSYQYSPFGDRLSKTDTGGTTYYLYSFGNILMELDGAGSRKAIYTYGVNVDEPISMVREGVTSYYLFDGLGSVTSLTDTNENVVANYRYDAFGKIIKETGTIVNPYTFTCREYDKTAELYYYRARYYDPVVGRFLSKDPVEMDGELLYVYVENNPVNFLDPSGERVIGKDVGVLRHEFWQVKHRMSVNLKGSDKAFKKSLKVFKQGFQKRVKQLFSGSNVKGHWQQMKQTMSHLEKAIERAKKAKQWSRVGKLTNLQTHCARKMGKLGKLPMEAIQKILQRKAAKEAAKKAAKEAAKKAAKIVAKKVAKKAVMKKLAGKALSKLVPGIGTALLAKDVWDVSYWAGEKMGELKVGPGGQSVQQYWNKKAVKGACWLGLIKCPKNRRVRRPGGENPDDNYDVSTLSYSSSTNTFNYKPEEIAILANGFYNEFSGLLAEVGESSTFVDIDTPLEELDDYPILIIPSGGFFGIDSLPSFKSKLENYVSDGGTLIVYSQQHGYEFDAAPGDFGGYGWTEDQSCQHRSVGISTYHPMLSGQDSTTLNVVVDGYFTSYPENATILLTRTKNGMPALLMYEYGNGTGTVIVTTVYTDWAYGHHQVTKDGKNLLRDMISWAKERKELSEYSSDDLVIIPINVTSYIDLTSDKVKFQVIADNEVMDTVEVTTSIPPYETKTVNFVYRAPANVGIFHVDYLLVNDSYGEVQRVHDAERFVVSKYAKSPGGFIYRGSEISLWITTPGEYFPRGSNVTATYHVKNDGDTAKNISCSYGFWHKYDQYREITVDAHSEETFTYTTKVWHSGRFEARYGGYKQYAYKGLWVFPPSVDIGIETDQKEYAKGEDVFVSLNLTNKQKVRHNATVTVRTLDPDNKKIYEDSFDANLSAYETKNKTLSFSLPVDSCCGTYIVTAEAYENEDKIGSNSAYFEIPKIYRLRVSFDKPNKVYCIRQNLSLLLNVTNTGSSVWSSWINTTIPAFSFSDSKFVSLNPNENREIEYKNLGIPIDLAPGKHNVLVNLSYDSSTTKDNFFIPCSDLKIEAGKKYSAGENIRFNISNVGGVDTDFNCSFKFVDWKGKVMYEDVVEDAVLSLKNKTIFFDIHNQSVNGSYYLIVSCKDKETGKETELAAVCEVSGLKADLTSDAERKIYFKNENVSIITNITNRDGEIVNGTLNLKIVRVSMPTSTERAVAIATAKLSAYKPEGYNNAYISHNSSHSSSHSNATAEEEESQIEVVPSPSPPPANFSYGLNLYNLIATARAASPLANSTPTPTPTPTPEHEPENETGELPIEELSLTPSINVTPTPTPEHEPLAPPADEFNESYGNGSVIEEPVPLPSPSPPTNLTPSPEEPVPSPPINVTPTPTPTPEPEEELNETYKPSAAKLSDIIIGNETVWKDEVKILSGNLIINSTGNLTLINSRLIMDCTKDGQYHIEVQNGGEMHIFDSEITAKNTKYEYYFQVKSGSKFEMHDSELHECGYTWGTNGDHAGLWINTNNVIIENNYIKDTAYYGIVLYRSNNSNLTNNSASPNSDSGRGGIYLSSSNNNTLTSNTASGHKYGSGIYLKSSNNNTLIDNIAKKNGDHGIYLSSSNNNTITNNIANSNWWSKGHGIYLKSSNNNELANNTAKLNDEHGIYLSSSSNNTLTNNTANSNDDYGIYLSSSSNNTLTNNTANSNKYYHGIYLSSSSNNELTSNTANSNDEYGIYLSSSNNNELTNNTANSNDEYGIYLSSSSNNTLTNNTAKENSKFDLFIHATSVSHCNNKIDNTTGSGDRPIRYFNSSVSLSDEILSELILCNSDHSDINNITVEGSSTKKNNGVLLVQTDFSNLTNITSSNNYQGIYLKSSSCNNSLTSNTVAGNSQNGIYLRDSCNDNIIINNSVHSNSQNGIYLRSSSINNSLKNNSVYSNRYGIYLRDSCDNNIMENNTINSNNFGGICLSESDHNKIKNNTVRSNYLGIEVDYSNRNNIENNTVKNSNYHGIDLGSSHSNRIINNNLSSNNEYGIKLSGSSSNVIKGNSIEKNKKDGFILQSGSNNNKIINNTVVLNTGKGIHLYYNWQLSSPSSNNMTGNNVSLNSGWGIGICGNDHILADNIVNSNGGGISLYRTSNNILRNNTINANSGSGITISTSSHNTLSNNSINNNKRNFGGVHTDHNDYDKHFNHSIDTSNTINDKPIYYLVNEKDKVYDATATDVGYFAAISCENITVKNLNLTKNSEAVFFRRTHNSSIENISGTSNSNGIYLWHSDNNAIFNSTLCTNSYGIYMRDASGTEIHNCNLSSNSNHGLYLKDSSKNNRIDNCNIASNSKHGVYIYWSSNNLINNCNISANKDYGLHFYHSGANKILNSEILGGKSVKLADGSTNCEISNNSISSNDKGLYVYDGSAKIFNNTINADKEGIYFYKRDGSVLRDNTVTSKSYPLYFGTYSDVIYIGQDIDLSNTFNDYKALVLYNTENESFSNLSFALPKKIKVTNYGLINLVRCENISIENATAVNHTHYGFFSYKSSKVVVENSTASSNNIGVWLEGSSRNEVRNSTITQNTEQGIYAHDAYLAEIVSNKITHNKYGVHTGAGGWAMKAHIQNNTIENNERGIYVDAWNTIIDNNIIKDNNNYEIYCDDYYATIENNTIITDKKAIYLRYSKESEVINNTIVINSGNGYGIYTGNSPSCLLEGNTVVHKGSSGKGIYIRSSSNTLINNNISVSDNTYGFYFDSLAQDMDASNTVNGATIILLSSVNGVTISNFSSVLPSRVKATNYGIINLYKCKNVTIENVTVANHSNYGIYLCSNSNNNTIRNSRLESNSRGVHITGSSVNNEIINNTMESNSVGIYCDGDRNTISKNTISSNSDKGIYLGSGSDENNITSNIIKSNNYGCYGDSNADYNLIYDNLFDNTINAYAYDNDNIWNITKTFADGGNIIGGPWLGGNYWSDYEGEDLDGDELGDTLLPYNCDGRISKGGDYLPLVMPLPPKEVLWEKNITINLAEDETKNILSEVPASVFKDVTGKQKLSTTLYSNTTQIINISDPFFYVTPKNTSLTMETDKRVYKPNETVLIYGEVKNHASAPVDCNLSIKKDGAEIFNDSFTLAKDETRYYTTNTTADTSFTLEGIVDGVVVMDSISVESPEINASIIAPDVVGIKDFDVGVLIENIGNISAELNVSLDGDGKRWNKTVPEGESQLLETTMNTSRNMTITVIISGDVNETIQKEIICGERAEINITPEPTYLEGEVEIPFTITNICVLDSEFNATFSISSPDNQTITKHFFVPKEENISDSISFNLTKGAHLLRYSSPFETVNTTINVLSPPGFIVSSIHPAELNFTIGENVTLLFTVKNVGGSEGEAALKLSMIDFEDTNRTWIIAGAEENISFNLTIPDDLEEKSYKGIYELDGTRSEFSFFVQGANISVDASLDKSMYAEGDTAVLTLELTNECKLDLDLYSRVKFNEYDSVQNFTLFGSGTETLVFYLPANFSGDNKVLYTVYMDSGRALYINSIYIYEELPDAPLRLFTDKDVYNMGEEVTIHIVDVTGTDMLNLTAPNFSYNDTISGPTTLEFTLPALRSGTYYIVYSFGNFSSTHPFDVRGYSARILEASLDKEEYISGNEMKLEMNIEANRDVSGLLKTWIYDPKDDLIDEFAMNKTLEEGENEIEVCRTLSTDKSGIHAIVYGFSAELSGDSSTMLVSGAEYFDAESVGLCGDVAPYPDCNGIVDMGDVILLLNNVSYPEDPRYVLCNDWAGDCRCTGVRDMGDVILLLNNVSYPEDPRYVLDCC